MRRDVIGQSDYVTVDESAVIGDVMLLDEYPLHRRPACVLHRQFADIINAL